MEGSLPASVIPADPEAAHARVEVVYRPGVASDRISPAELEVIGTYLPELVGQLLQMTADQDNPEGE